MNLKKIIPVLLMAISIGFFTPAFAGNETPVNPIEKANNDVHAQQLLDRLKEIRAMDKSNLTSVEKKELRKELKEIKREYKRERDRKNGIYLSVGAIIIIILLLILILR
jgi:hypothetical protein